MPSFLCLVNPLSGGRSGERIISELRRLSSAQREIVAVPIDFGNLAEQINQAQRFDRLLIAGGDGTFSAVLSNLPSSSISAGIIPLGTGNDLARALGVIDILAKRGLSGLIEYYTTASTKSVQLWRVSSLDQSQASHCFINYLSFGFDAEVVTRFSRARSGSLKFLHRFGKMGNRLGYFLCGLFCLPRLHRCNFEITTQNLSVTNACSLFFSNIKEVMGLGISNQLSSPFDSLLECRVIRNFFDYLSFAGLRKYVEGGILQFEQVEFRIKPPFSAQIDGEPWIERIDHDTKSTSFLIKPGPRITLLC